MTSTTPHDSADPPHTPDHLAGAVLQSLLRPPTRKLAWSTAQTTIAGLFTFGIVPLLVLPRRFAQQASYERQQMWHLAEWLRLQTGRTEAQALRDETSRLRASPLLMSIGPILFSIIGVAVLVGQVIESSWEPGVLRRFVYRGEAGADLLLPMLYILALSTGYALCHWLGINEYVGRMRRFIAAFNRLAEAEKLAPVRAPATQLGFSAAAFVVGVLFCVAGAWWGLPMMIAATAQRQYITRASPRLGRELAQRVRDLLRQRNPHMAHAVPIYVRHPCINERCSAWVPAGARFCSRCGTPTEARIDRVA